MFTRIKLFFYELFVYTIPDKFEKFKDWLFSDIYKIVALSIITFALGVGIYQGFNYHKYSENQKVAKKIITKQKNDSMGIVSDGPKAYLRLQLGVKTDDAVIKLFNNNVKLKGQYDQTIKKAESFTKQTQYWNYLNPIVTELLSGNTLEQQNTNIDFADKAVEYDSDESINGVLLILIDSKDKNQVQKVQNILKANHDYSIKVYDKNVKNGSVMFEQLRTFYLFSGEGELKGFDSSNDYTGVAYGFFGNNFVYHNKTLDGIPGKLPTNSLGND